MEVSTAIFIATLIIAFIFLRWLITPIPPNLPLDPQPRSAASQSATSGQGNGGSAGTSRQRRNNREVSDSMVEVVQAIAPQLTPAQIRYDLQRSGSIELTIENFMTNGTLPFPPGESAPAAPAAAASESSHNQPPKESANANLIDKYNLQDKIDAENGTADAESSQSSRWSANKDERQSLLSKRREEMILSARKRLASQLQNEL